MLLKSNPQRGITILQFFSIAFLGMVGPYVNLYLKDQDVSATLIGTLLSIGALLRLLLTPVANNIADRLGLHRRLFRLYYAAMILASGLFVIADSAPLLGIGMLLFLIAQAPSVVLGMQLTISKLQHEGQATLGRTRSFAAVGFGAANLVSGGAIALGGYPLIFGTGIVLGLATLWLATVYPPQTMNAQQKEEMQTAAPVPRNKGLYVMSAGHFFIAMGYQSAFAFTFIHFNENLGVALGYLGIVMASIVALEVPGFRILDPLLLRYGARRLYVLGAIGVAAYLFGLGIIPTPYWLVPVVIVRAVFWPMLHVSSFVVASQMSDPRNVATNQALIQVTVPGIATLLTGSAAGWLFEYQGALAFFGAAAVACLIGAVIVAAGYRLMAPTEEGAS